MTPFGYDRGGACAPAGVKAQGATGKRANEDDDAPITDPMGMARDRR